jgi:NADH dehydrogenase
LPNTLPQYQQDSPPHHIVIVGGGAGGLELAVRLGKKLGKKGKARITLIDASRTHLWKPLLHQVAAGTLDSHIDEVEYFALARKHHFTFRLGRMEGLLREHKQVVLAPTRDEDGAELMGRQIIAYDTLVFAVGSQSNDFNTPGVREHCILLDTPEAAQRFHQRLINSCLRAQNAARLEGDSHFSVTIIGGGATGVELAAELHMTTKIAVVDAGSRLLPALPERLSNAVARELRSMDIDVHTNEKVVEVSKEGVRMASGTFIPSGIVVWAAGIKVAEFMKEIGGLESNRINQLKVLRTLQTTRDADIFALGDCAECPQGESKPAVPPRAQAAHQMAALLASSLQRRLKGQTPLEYTYHDYGSLVSLGDYSTVGTLMGAITSGSVFIEGTIAKWMYWWLHKDHEIAVNGWMAAWLQTLAELINRVRNPRIKLH